MTDTPTTIDHPMALLALRGLVARAGRLALVATSIALAAGFTTASLGFTQSFAAHFDRVAATGLHNLDVVVESGQDHLTDGDLAAVAALPDIAAVEGEVAGSDVLALNEAAIIRDGSSVAALGTLADVRVWPETNELTPYRLVEGRGPAGDEIVIDVNTASSRGIELGDVLTTESLSSEGGLHSVTVTGTVRYGSEDLPPTGPVALVDDKLARELVGIDSGWTALYVGVGTNPQEAVTTVAAAVGASVRPRSQSEFGLSMPTFGSYLLGAPTESGRTNIRTGDEARAAVRSSVRDSIQDITGFVAVFSIGAVVVGGAVIANGFSILAAQRSRELALLRAVGAQSRDLRRSLTIEAAAVGTIASLLGAAVGAATLATLAWLSNESDLGLPLSAGATLPAFTWLVGVGVAFGVTMFASRSAVRRATRTIPIAALREIDSSDEPTGHRRLASGGLVAFATAAVAGYGLGPGSPALLLLAALGLVVTVALLLPMIVVAAVRSIGPFVSRVGGVSGDLAVGNTLRHRRRASATASALAVGVGLVAFVAVFLATVSDWGDGAAPDPFLAIVMRTVVLLLVAAVLMAVIGVANTVGLSILERMREIGLLRAVGATRNQIVAVIRWEAALLSGIGAAVGVVVGTTLAATIVYVQGSAPTEGNIVPPITVEVPALTLLGLVAIGIAAGVLATIPTARRAARLDILQALAVT